MLVACCVGNNTGKAELFFCHHHVYTNLIELIQIMKVLECLEVGSDVYTPVACKVCRRNYAVSFSGTE